MKSDHLEGRWEDLCGRAGSMFSGMDVIPGLLMGDKVHVRDSHQTWTYKDKDGGSSDDGERPTGPTLCDGSL